MAKKINEKADPKVISNIITSEMVRNQDGFCLLTDKGNRTRTLNKEEFCKSMEKAIPKCEWIVAHARFATKGSVNLNNIHLWELNKFSFAHNGIIGKYHSYYDRNKDCDSDSLQYFKALVETIKSLDKKHVAKRIKKSEFFNGGRAILIDPNKKMYIFGDFKVYEYKGWLIVSSCSVDVGNKKEINYGDLKMHKNSFSSGSLNGIYIFDPDEITFEKLGKIPERTYKEFAYKDYFSSEDDVFENFKADEPVTDRAFNKFKKYQVGLDM